MVRFLVLLVMGLVFCVPSQGKAETKSAGGTDSQEKSVPGEYLVMFHPKAAIQGNTGATRRALTALMLEMQGEYLANRYGLTVVRAFDAIAETTGKGMFHVRSDLAAKDSNVADKLLSLLDQDLLIESVAPNREKKLLSAP